MNRPAILKILTCALILLSAGYSKGQTYRFTNFGQGSNIPDPFVYTITQNASGILWVGTSDGLSRFDGFNFYRVEFPDSQQVRKVTVSHCDKNGILWFGCDDGSLFYVDGNEIYKTGNLEVQTINAIVDGPENTLLIIPQDKKILSIDINDRQSIKEYYLKSDVFLATGLLTEDNSLLLGTQESLLLCRFDGDSVIFIDKAEGIDYSRVQALLKLPDRKSYLAGTQGSGLFLVSPLNGRLETVPANNIEGLGSSSVTSLLADKEGNIWAGTEGDGLYRFRTTPEGLPESRFFHFTKESGLSGETVSSIFQDIEGNKWIGFFGDGLSMMRSGSFSFYAPSLGDRADNNVVFVEEYGGKYFLGTDKGYYIFDPVKGETESYRDLSRLVGNSPISWFEITSDNRIFISTRGNGIYLKRADGSVVPFYRSGNQGEDYISHISSDGNILWLATTYGITVLNSQSGAVVRRFTNDDLLPHNSINQLFLQKDGKVLVATECDKLYRISPKGEFLVGEEKMVGFSRNKVLSFAESGESGVWASTFGNGVFYIANDTVMNITTVNGLYTNFCYSILEDSHNQVWIGHAGGISKYNAETGTVKVFQTDFARNSNCNPGAITETSSGLILIGTTEGFIIYDHSLEKRHTLPPVNNIMAVYINDIRQPLKSSYTRPYGSYTIKIDYVGINLSNPEKVYYSTMLENWDDKWSEPKFSRQVVYPVRDGRFRFFLRSVSEEGLTQQDPLTIDFFIRKPFWRTWWFLLICFAVAGGVVWLIIYQRDKAQKKIKAYLESELEARTRLVMQQKEELEIQNLEIKDSINYAKRIQTSILPDITKLKESFRDSFILFHPRDIVSGDFYWFDKISDEKFIIVCADSTGHGVPGAFMSMIGSTLLQDIISRKGITRPSEILSLLDKQIFSTLNQNVEIGISNDGMDMVVCEINPKTRHVRFASAMRPVIIVIDGEAYYIKGNRCSVGGESVIEKYFDDQEYYLSEGDSIYLFSDGLPDQFGGVDGKKMKIARLKTLIEDIGKLPMADQKEAVSAFFFEWKGDYEQVDDVLVMGIKL